MKSLHTLLFGLLTLLPASGVEYAWTTFAGKAGGPGYLDSVNGEARFHIPTGVAVDGSGNVYVCDLDNKVIRKITPGGTVTTLAGLAGNAGSANGTGSAARFDFPVGVAVEGSGTLYVMDANNTIRKITPGGTVTTLAGSAGAFGWGVAVDGSRNVYVADPQRHVIRKIAPGGPVSTLAGLSGSSGSADGTGTAARFRGPTGVAVDGSGNVYVAEYGNKTVRKITPARVVTTLAGLAGFSGSEDGTGSAARFRGPHGLALDGSGNVYVADRDSHTIRRITPGGEVSTLAGQAGVWGSADGVGAEAQFSGPEGIAADGSGNLYVADGSNHTIRKITPGGAVTTLAGLAGSSGYKDGTGSGARFNSPTGVAVDGSGNVYVTDFENRTIRKITSVGAVSTIGGKAGVIGNLNGTGAASRFGWSRAVAVDGAGNVYVGDYEGAIRKGIPLLSGLELWRKTHFGIPDNSGPAADSFDFEGDGLVNLTEFAFGLDPKASSSGQLPQWLVSDGKLAVSFPAPAGVSGVTYGAEWSTNLSSGSWTPIADGGTGDTHAFSVPMAGRPRLFVRFTITAP